MDGIYRIREEEDNREWAGIRGRVFHAGARRIGFRRLLSRKRRGGYYLLVKLFESDGGCSMRDEVFDIPGNLFLSAKVLVEGLYQGRHATPDLGSGSTEFYDYRMYSPGDCASQIDWKVFGRTDRLYLRRFQHFGNLTLQVIVDGSASMGFAGFDNDNKSLINKWEYASRIAAALAIIAVRQSELVTLGIGVDRLEHVVRSVTTWPSLYRLIHILEGFEPHDVIDLSSCLREAGELIGRRHVIFILSDFLDEDVDGSFEAVRQLRFRGHDVTAVQILTAAELTLGGGGGIGEGAGVGGGRFVDIEGGDEISGEVDAIRGDYAHRMRLHIDGLRRGFGACGVDHFLLRTDEHPVEAIRRILENRNRNLYCHQRQ